MTPISRRQLMALAVLGVAAAGCGSSGGTAGGSTSSAPSGLDGVQFDVHRDPG